MSGTDRAAKRWVCDVCGTDFGYEGRVTKVFLFTDTGRLICYGGCPPAAPRPAP